ncbi:Nucleolar complex protein 4 [Ostreococcus tauri]|nr:Nucleolar complex protein 4 [Ostreococcus tauri]CEG00328.1 Nucleolar complex protein 4 [Ostreococcus tauri]|eukprot:XP_003083570.2 Nucleolar complex protein 4 [Ostreococcus tauri]
MGKRNNASSNKTASASTQTVAERAINLNASDSNVNEVLELLRAIKSPTSSTSRDAFDALVGLERFWCERLASGTLDELRESRKREDEAETPRRKYLEWFAKHYRTFTERTMDVMCDGGWDGRTRTLALAVLMECARCETPGRFSNEMYEEVVRRATSSADWSEELLGAMKTRYLTRVDVRYYTYVAMKKIAEGLRTYEAKAGRASRTDVARNVYDVLNATPREFEDHQSGNDASNPRDDFARMLAKLRAGQDAEEEAEKRGPWCEDAEGGAVDLESAKKRRKISSSVGASKWTEGVRHRRAFSEAWLALLRAEFPEDIYRKILMRLHVDVMPHMVNPQLLSDFCVDSIDVGGLTGMLALNGLFILMTQHGLEYPTFYNRLYQLLDGSCFHANHRRGFFSLMDVFLKSPALPAYLVASFVKRFARLSLSAPPAGAMLCVAFIHNLIRRHKSCAVLVHRENAATVDADPFDADEQDPAKTNALKSSVWEMETLRAHYCAQVPKMVSLLERDLTERVKTKELDMGDLCAASYGTLIAEEFDVRMKKVPLANHVEPFTSLFSTPEMKRCFDTFA